MKDTYNYETKRRARVALREFIERFYTKPSRRKELRVLTLLGHEPYELEQVWDPLGVPRENILCIESKRRIYDYIRKQNWGVCMLDTPTSLESYVAETRETFDVINIDGVSPFEINNRISLGFIAGRHLFGEKGILATWYHGKRERGYTKKWFEKMEGQLSRESISKRICAFFLDGDLNKGDLHPYIHPKHYPERYKEFLLWQKSRKRDDDHSDLRSYDPRTGKIVNPTGNLIYVDDVHTFVEKKLEESVSKVLSDECLSNLVTKILFYGPLNSYYSFDQRRLKYIGDKGSPMLVDFNYFKQVPASETLLEFDESSGPESWNLRKKNVRFPSESASFAQIVARSYDRCNGSLLAPREHLGSSFGENKEKDMASLNSPNNGGDYSKINPAIVKTGKKLPKVPMAAKEEIRKLRREGFDIEDIWHHIRGKGYEISEGQCRAIAAWESEKLRARRRTNNSEEKT